MAIFNRIFARHAHYTMKHQDDHNPGISHLGAIQAIKMGRLLADLHIKDTTQYTFPVLSEIFVSKYLRTHQTAEIIAMVYEIHGLPVPAINKTNDDEKSAPKMTEFATSDARYPESSVLCISHKPALPNQFAKIVDASLAWDTGSMLFIDKSASDDKSGAFFTQENNEIAKEFADISHDLFTCAVTGVHFLAGGKDDAPQKIDPVHFAKL